MFNIESDFENKKVILKIHKLTPKQKMGIRKGFYFIGKDLIKTANKLILSKPKSGVIYRINKNGRITNHQSSDSGQSPANLTGSLRRSLDFDVVGGSKLMFGVKSKFQNRSGSANGVDYGLFLEEGTSKMAKRPFLIPSIKSNYRNAIKHFEAELKKEIYK